MVENFDKRGKSYLQIKYYDFNGEYLAEYHYLDSDSNLKKFHVNFLRSHMKRPEFNLPVEDVEDVLRIKNFFRLPAFIIARKQDKFWKITEKIFVEELSR